jgi:replicative DNA helicase
MSKSEVQRPALGGYPALCTASFCPMTGDYYGVRLVVEGADLRRRHRPQRWWRSAQARRLKLREPALGLIVVDYVQLMTSGASVENRVQEVSAISRSLKVLARDLDVPVLALSQLSRAVEQRHDKRPILSDLRESGSLEQDADLVFFIYRDEYYDAESDQQGLAEVHLAKHRNGPTGTAKLSFLKRFAKFADLANV